ncbi:MAG: hypothetical protein RIT01_387 [Pseudomonadota bacterium]|jgi:hypothetical protein
MTTKRNLIIDYYVEIEELLANNFTIKDVLQSLKTHKNIAISEIMLKKTLSALRNKEIIPKHERICIFSCEQKKVKKFTKFAIFDNVHNIYFIDSRLICNIPEHFIINDKNLLTKTYEHKLTAFFIKTVLNLKVLDKDIFEKFNINSVKDLIEANEIRQTRISTLNAIIERCETQYIKFQLNK